MEYEVLNDGLTSCQAGTVLPRAHVTCNYSFALDQADIEQGYAMAKVVLQGRVPDADGNGDYEHFQGAARYTIPQTQRMLFKVERQDGSTEPLENKGVCQLLLACAATCMQDWQRFGMRILHQPSTRLTCILSFHCCRVPHQAEHHHCKCQQRATARVHSVSWTAHLDGRSTGSCQHMQDCR